MTDDLLPATPVVPVVPVVAVVGATAAGKTALSLDLAERLGGEIVNTDAMQVYRGMDVGTAKVPHAERRGIPHHLLDLFDVTAPATVAQFQALARDVVADCRNRGVPPVLVGGSALYTRAVLDGFEFPGTDPAVRARLEAELADVGSGALHRRLAGVDPASAARIEPANGRRVVRALEVVEITGGPYSATLPEPTYVLPGTVQIGVRIPRAVLDQRIEERVRRMWEAGLVEEVRGLAGHGLREGRTAHRALGYRQVLTFLDGECSEEEALDRTVFGTRRFARRQESWFFKDERIAWVGWDDPDRLERAEEAVRAAIEAPAAG
ncbi:MAG: tRNA (adenosine(37)-N6)-dimethylallyltransferase MiaA [Nocardioidaceae bacterium]